ncbi:MAG: putative toxin-antitoxin system toxin component, PIN family [candidate division Zixibacteria bacterium]|nr:putative toxin-antitoxin system toxin component, PIN family [candidate division Zixibacteria bacterium]
MLKAVLDTNLFISALLTAKGNPAKILNRWKAGSFDLVISLPILKEIKRVILYPKIRKRLNWTDVEINEFLLGLAQFGFMVSGESKIDVIKDDPTDNKYLACALEGNADYIVTGDQHLLKVGEYRGTKIISPKEFLEILKKA